MMVLQVRDLIHEYEGKPVLTGVTFHLAGGERVGLVGANGCGKSTLMRILAGELEHESGAFQWVTNGLTRAYLSQDGRWDPDRPISEQMGPVDDDTLARCGLTRNLLARTPGRLSGGQKTRAALARALADRADLLLLDEPTNHLDTEGLTWLEEFLAAYRGTVLVVSHDRYFLDRVATRVLEMEHGQVKEYPGNYSVYARQKQLELERAREEYRTYLQEKKHLEAAIRQRMEWAVRGHAEKPDRMEGRFQLGINRDRARDLWKGAKAMEKRLERMKVEKPREATSINLRFDEGLSGGRNLILAENLGFTFDGARWLFRHAGFYVQRGEKVAIVGPNGAGKTTLLRLLLGELTPTEGRLYCSPQRISYLSQEMEHLTPTNTVLQEASGGNSAMDQAYARSLLGCLLFSGEDVLKPVAVLSGGEKVRLALAKILLSAPDLLVLDEPTNGLDLPSRERVEEALVDYPGTLLLVSHDRYLLSRVASKIISVKGGKLSPFGGGYDEFARGKTTADHDRHAQRILLELRLAQISAQLPNTPEEQKERLNEEFIQLSRQIRAMQDPT